MRILAIDVSGNFKEGKGTSGFCFMENGEPKELFELKASNFSSAENYWLQHLNIIKKYSPDTIVLEGYRLYNHKGMKASSQSNSELETVQLIGAIKVHAKLIAVPVDVQFATEVKSRWSEKVLVAKEILEKKSGNRYYFKNKVTNNHQRDALKHALHYWRYKAE